MTQVTRKELVDNVLRPAFTNNDNMEDILTEIIFSMRILYPKVAEGFMKAVRETHKKASEE